MVRRSLAVTIAVVVLAVALGACTPVRGGSQRRTHHLSLLARVNLARAEAGVPRVRWCPSLAAAARAHATDQARSHNMSHASSDGSNFEQRAAWSGYTGWTALGENVAAGWRTLRAVMRAWMQSAGHRANILNRAYTDFGAGMARASDGYPYWVQEFGAGGRC
jgi:uncharacterized protein YkwD